MLPSHYGTAQTPFSRLTKGEPLPLGRRPFIRWVTLTCVILGLLLFFANPISIPTFRLADEAEPPAGADGPPNPTGMVKTELLPPSAPAPTPPAHHDKDKWDERKELVRKSFLHGWKGYMSQAFPNDEVLPVSGRFTNSFNGWAVTLVDSLDTMWLMGLKSEFKEAVGLIKRQKFVLSANAFAPFFETVIRYLGGYLSAYALSGERVLLSLADDLGQRLLPVFNTEIGWPAFSVKPNDGGVNYGDLAGRTMLLAELASCQIEYKYLSKLTGRPEYYERAENVMKYLYQAEKHDGLFAERWFLSGKPMNSHYTAGAGADSAYEYLLKQYLLDGDPNAKKQYLESIEAIINKLLFVTPNRQLLYLTDITGNRETVANQMEHLSCYLPGLLALGAQQLDLHMAVKERHQWAAEGLAYTCWVLYADQASGLGPDNAVMTNGGKWVDTLREWEEDGRPLGKPPGTRAPLPEPESHNRDYSNTWGGQYLLRPETIESLYLMWKTTGDEIWRERGYAIYEAIEKHTKTTHGYSSVGSVDTARPHLMDEMPSFFLAETLKYLYLLFDNDDPISLDKWVFNTEAHPIPIFSWDENERMAFNITS